MLNNQEIKAPVLIKDLGMLYATEKSKHRVRFGMYKCVCGKEFKAQSRHIVNLETKSCGCMTNSKNRTHGLYYHKLHQVWSNMITRVENKKSERYYRYGARGISICLEWRKDFKSFYDWCMQNGWNDNLQLDRIDNDGNYDPSNCRLVTLSVNVKNTCILKSNNTSGFRGVSRNRNMWQSQIKNDKKIHYLGVFKDPKEAAIAYDTFVIVYGLDHTCNFPKGVFKL